MAVKGWIWNGIKYDFQDSRVDDLASVARSGSYNDLTDKPVVDSALNESSTNAVQNKVVMEGLGKKQGKHKTATATLTAASWSSLAQTVVVTGVTASNTVVVSPAPASAEAWGKAGVYAASQSAGKITFKCKKAPSAELTANVVVLD